MNTTDVTFPGAHSLSDLEQFADQQEEFLGPLVNLGNAGPDSVLTFDLDDDPAAEPVVLRTTPGGMTPAVDGFRLVCQGNCMVAGQLTGVAALRSSGTRSAIPAAEPGSALEQMLLGELPAAMKYRAFILAAVAARTMPPAVVAAIGSVESGWGTSASMQPNGPSGTGDRTPRTPAPPLRPGSMPTDGLGFGRGLMQIDWDSHPFARTGNWQDAAANIDFACGLLAADRDRFATQTGLAGEDALMAAVAAYNAGFGAASELIKDKGLKAAFAPEGYGAKVLKRIGFFNANGFGSLGAPALSGLTAIPGVGPFVAVNPEKFLTQSVGDGECVAFVRAASGAPHTLAWRQGAAVKGNKSLTTGTAIATFDPSGRYGNHVDGRSHAAIYLKQDKTGLVVLDQFRRPNIQPVHQRPLPFGGATPANDGNAFYVIQ